MAELRGRDLMIQALDRYRKSPNREDAEKVIRGAERTLEALVACEDAFRELREEFNQKVPDGASSAHDQLVWATYEDHQLRHAGPWSICGAHTCRAAFPLLEEAIERLSKVYRPLVVLSWGELTPLRD